MAPPTCAAPLALCSERRCTYGAFQLPPHLKFGIALSYIERERERRDDRGRISRAFWGNEGFAELTIKAREKVLTFESKLDNDFEITVENAFAF